jgi:Ca2+-binding RTX toxin-like protein
MSYERMQTVTGDDDSGGPHSTIGRSAARAEGAWPAAPLTLPINKTPSRGDPRARRTIVVAIFALAALSLVALAVPARASAQEVTVSVSGGELNLLADNAPMGAQVEYLPASDEWRIIDSFATAGSGCEDVSSAVVECPEGGEDIDADFDSEGGFVDLRPADGTLDYDSNITLGNGSDTVHGGSGADVVTAASPTSVNGDTVNTYDGDDSVTTANGSDIISGGDGSDIIDAGNLGNNIVNGGEFAGDDVDDGIDVITGGTLGDTLDGGGGNDTIVGGGAAADTADDDTIDGGAGVDDIDAGGGEDDVDGQADGDTIDAGDGNDTEVFGGPGNDTINGGPGNDTLDGGENTSGADDSDTLNGDAGDDTLLNNDGPETFNGGASETVGDEVDYSPTTAAASLTVDIDGVADDGRNCPGASCEGDNVGTTVENVTGDTSPDTITGSSATSVRNVLDGGGGSDTLAGGPGPGGDGVDKFVGGSATDTVTYAARTGAITADIDGAADDAGEADEIETDVENLIGGSAGDNLTGNLTGDNALSGGPGTGNDTLNGLGGNDTLRGGTGANPSADGADVFRGGDDADTVSYQGRTGNLTADLDGVTGDDPDSDTIDADVEDLIGGSGSDTLTGNRFANTLNGDAGSDTLAGGAGTGVDGADKFVGGTNGSGGDTVTYASRTGAIVADLDGVVGDDPEGDTIGADVENLTGGLADDSLTGNAQENELRGGPGKGLDTLSGGDEDDTFFGGTGLNAVSDGADTFIAGNQGEDGDTVSYDNRADPISARIGGSSGTDGDDIQPTIDNLLGGDADDTLTGDGDANLLRGFDGNDTLAGGISAGPDGADHFVGDVGAADTVTYARRSDDVRADLRGFGEDDGASGELDDLSSSVENITGGLGDDDLFGDGDANVLNGAGGDDVLAGGFPCPGCTLSGPDGNDRFVGGDHGTPGGQHTALGDLVTYFNRTDGVTARIGASANGGAGEADEIDATTERLTGGQGDDTLTGDVDPNRLEGLNGDDVLAGGVSVGPDGRDIFVGGPEAAAGDTVTYAARTDPIAASIASGPTNGGGGCPSGLTCEDDDIQSSVENLIGGSAGDTLTGDGDPNTLEGGPGVDSLSALGGADEVLVSDGGPDSADCGEGTDTAFVDSTVLDVLTACETAETPPETTITDQPRRRTTSRSATFRFISGEASQFECSLDGGAFAACSSPKRFTGLSRGVHRFEVRAVDDEGNRDPSPATARWKVIAG